MSLLKYFVRDDTTVKINLDSDLGTCKPIYPFSFNCGDQETAELLTRHLNEELVKFKKGIANDALCYLTPSQITKLKARLKDWDGRKCMWK